MSNIITFRIWCPLCEREMRKMPMLYQGRVVKAYTCRHDKIFTFDFDPAFNKWRDTDKVIECPHCNQPMKWFSRFVDRYVKAHCPHCGFGFEKDSDVLMNKDGTVELEDFKQEEPEEIEINIPISKLKIGEDAKKGLSQKLKQKREKEGRA